MQYHPLGSSGFEVSVIAFGAWQIGDPDYWGEDAEADAVDAVRAALDSGVNLFDTAEAYGDGESERMLGRALGADKDQVYIATKVSDAHCAPADLRRSCEQSLERLGRDYIDLYQIHWPFDEQGHGGSSSARTTLDTTYEDTCAELSRLRDEGKIRHIGVSNFGKDDLERWLGVGEAVSNQLAYSLAFRAIEYEIAPLCRQNQIGVLAYSPLLQGILAGRYASVDEVPMLRRRTRHFSSERNGTRHGEPGCENQLMETVHVLEEFSELLDIPMATIALSWVASQPGVSSVIVGGRKRAQLERNLAAADLDLGPAAIAKLNELTYPLKRALGANADMWQSGEASRIR